MDLPFVLQRVSKKTTYFMQSLFVILDSVVETLLFALLLDW